MERKLLNISKPIVVQLSSGATPATDVILFNSLENFCKKPNPLKSDPGYGLPLGFSVSVPFFTYGNLLRYLLNNSYQIGLIEITVLVGTNVMLRNPLEISAYNMLGKGSHKTEFMSRNIFQNTTNQAIHNVDFLLSADTTIKIGGTFRKNTTVEYAFYPSISYDMTDINNYGREYRLPALDSVEVINKREQKILIDF